MPEHGKSLGKIAAADFKNLVEKGLVQYGEFVDIHIHVYIYVITICVCYVYIYMNIHVNMHKKHSHIYLYKNTFAKPF